MHPQERPNFTILVQCRYPLQARNMGVPSMAGLGRSFREDKNCPRAAAAGERDGWFFDDLA
jgi:hypothetical protein